jgi:hypothetical protein
MIISVYIISFAQPGFFNFNKFFDFNLVMLKILGIFFFFPFC